MRTKSRMGELLVPLGRTEGSGSVTRDVKNSLLPKHTAEANRTRNKSVNFMEGKRIEFQVLLG